MFLYMKSKRMKLILKICSKNKDKREACKKFADRMERELRLVAMECKRLKGGRMRRLQISFGQPQGKPVFDQLKVVLDGECAKFLKDNSDCIAETSFA